MTITTSPRTPKTTRRPGLLPHRYDAGDQALAGLCAWDGSARVDVLGLDQLAQYAERLARGHQWAAGQRQDRLLPRLEENGRILEESYRLLNHRSAEGRDIPPGGVWFLENFYLIQQQTRLARQHLPRKYSRTLPQLSGGSGFGLPRVYDLALEFIAHVDGRLEPEDLYRFVRAYQQAAPLRLGELWAIPIMLRLALLENLRHAAVRILQGLANPDGQDPAADQVSVSNSIISLQSLGALDWKEFVEAQSRVERILRHDPAGVYGQMDFASRDRYRSVVEQLARRSCRSEQQVAQMAVKLARATRGGCPESAAARPDPKTHRECHVGYYLVDRGRTALESSIGYRRSWRDVLGRSAARAPLTWYLGATLLVWLTVVVGASAASWKPLAATGLSPVLGALLLALFGGAAGQLAVSLVNWGCTMLVSPRPMMRLDFSDGIPPDCRTLVAVPTMLTGESAIRDLLEQLELRYLANQDDNLLFALVTDFTDAAQETLPSDEGLLDLARRGIARLNERHGGSGPFPFFLLHRPRKWNAQEGVWMGEERKRGKLAALNQLLRSGDTGAFCAIAGEVASLRSVRYVITLDTDTRLPHGAARELVGCIAHPLNRPELDPRTRLVARGHAILQPRISATIPEANRTRFSRLSAGEAGIDPYTRQTSDVYQDAFAEGSFIGKGIYDVEAFEMAMEGRFPPGRVLSHDLIEGCFARSGFVNDVDLFEGCPSRLLADMSRRHRWIRGDWQVAAWLWPRVPAARGTAANRLSPLSRWKILDNLRRSLTPVFLLGFLLAGWTLAPALAAWWTILALGLVFVPALIAAVPGLVRKPPEKPWRLHVHDQADNARKALLQEALSLGILPYVVHCHLDAIGRTLYRLHVSRRKLLEWTTAHDAEVRCEDGCRGHYEIMWACTIVSLATAALLAILAPAAWMFAGPLLLAWLSAPLVAWWTSRPHRPRAVVLTDDQTRHFGRWARHAWHFFETFAGEEDHWLPPDNVQEHPRTMLATRTSPTNLSMALLADLSASDLGYLSSAEFLKRTGRTLHTMRRLERHQGHFYNWYDTRTLRPLEPRYISSVDSGNLWAALVVLRVGLKEMRDRPLVSPRLLTGLRDTLEALATLRRRTPPSPPDDPFDTCLEKLRQQCVAAPLTGARQARALLDPTDDLAAELAAYAVGGPPALHGWTQSLLRQCDAACREISQLAFWTQVGPASGSQRIADELSEFGELAARLDAWDAHCTLGQVPLAAEETIQRADRLLETIALRNGSAGEAIEELKIWLHALRRAARHAETAARERLQQAADSAELCRQFSEMDFRFLFHGRKKLLAVGYNASEGRRDNSFYDLLASESRLTSFLAISHGQLPQEHWFALGRMMTVVHGEAALLSWSGSMFEYLMPMLLMPSYPGTLLDASCRAAVRRQMRYARRLGVPWGISESCYHLTDVAGVYQYRAFGVPGLGLERGLGKHLVIAPYASALAALVAPREACENLRRLERLGCLGPFGFHDALDYTPGRCASSGAPAACRTVMAHHSGMTLLAMASVLLDGPIPRRFLKNSLCKAHDLLLQERVPQAVRPVDLQDCDHQAAAAGEAAKRRMLREAAQCQAPGRSVTDAAAPGLGERRAPLPVPSAVQPG